MRQQGFTLLEVCLGAGVFALGLLFFLETFHYQQNLFALVDSKDATFKENSQFLYSLMDAPWTAPSLSPGTHGANPPSTKTWTVQSLSPRLIVISVSDPSKKDPGTLIGYKYDDF